LHLSIPAAHLLLVSTPRNLLLQAAQNMRYGCQQEHLNI
jgi:hypothetical protein